jgi:hypothetical protein
MARLEELTCGAAVKGILPDCLVTVVDVKWIGTVAIELTYKAPAGRLGNELLYRDREPTLEVAAQPAADRLPHLERYRCWWGGLPEPADPCYLCGRLQHGRTHAHAAG